MKSSRTAILLLLMLVIGLAGCGGDDGAAPPTGEAIETMPQTAENARQSSTVASEADDEADAADAADAADSRRPAGEDGLRVPATRAKIVVKQSEFGRVLFDANGQVVYAFENDRRDESNCTSADCVKAWPPVLTREKPSAGAGIDAGLLGTIRRDDDSLQVTYNGRPLYFYEHEAPGEIRCHDVDLHGGLWWVVTPRGIPAA